MKTQHRPKNKAVSAVAKAVFKVMNYLAWEAGMKWVYDPDRGQVGYWPHSGPQDPIEANDLSSRLELIRKVQEYERNNAVVNRLLDVFELFTVGAGGMPILPASGDERWNIARKALWDRWCQIPDLTSLQSFPTMQSLCARRWPADGRILVNLTRSDTPFRLPGNSRPQFHPRIQLIESARIQTPSNLRGRSDVIDGIQVDSKGRPIAYHFTERVGIPDVSLGITLGENRFTSRPAEFIVDISEPMRPGEYHPMPLFSPVLNDIQDLDELAKQAKKRSKSRGKVGLVFNTETGEIPDPELVRNIRYSEQGELTSTGDTFTKERLEEYQRVLGVANIALKTNEKVTEIGAQSPNEIEQSHWDIIVNRICAGFGVSKLLLFPNSMQGTVVRADLDISNIFFRARSAVLQEKFLKIYEYVTDQECQYEPSIADRPPDWQKASIRSPRGCNVDVGRNSQAMIAEYLNGMRSLRSIYGDLGQDWREEIDQIQNEKAYIMAGETKRMLAPGTTQSAISEALQNEMADEAEDTANNDKIDEAITNSGANRFTQ